MTKLIINSKEEALALREKINHEITIIEFAPFQIGDEEIFALNSFVRNNGQSLEVIDLRGVLELQYKHLTEIAENANLHSASLKMVSLNAANLHGATKKNHRLSEERLIKEKFTNYQQYLQKKYPDFSKQNRTNFSVNLPAEFLQLIDVFQRNIEISITMSQDQEWKDNLELAEAELEEGSTITGEKQLQLYAKYKEWKAPGLASEGQFGDDFVEVPANGAAANDSDEEDFEYEDGAELEDGAARGDGAELEDGAARGDGAGLEYEEGFVNINLPAAADPEAPSPTSTSAAASSLVATGRSSTLRAAKR